MMTQAGRGAASLKPKLIQIKLSYIMGLPDTNEGVWYRDHACIEARRLRSMGLYESLEITVKEQGK